MTEPSRDPAGTVRILPVDGLPDIIPGDPLVDLVGAAIEQSIGKLVRGDVVAVTHKVVSKAEGAVVDLADVEPSRFARDYAAAWNKDPRQVEVVLRQSRRIVRMVRGLIISETAHGFICANAGVDASNMTSGVVGLLPEDPDASAERLRAGLVARFFPGDATPASPIGVIVTDSFGRPWRNGIVNVAIGVAGMAAMADYRGHHDPSGYELRASVLAVADELAAAAELVMHKIALRPVAVVRGYEPQGTAVTGTGRDLVMAEDRNLFV